MPLLTELKPATNKHIMVYGPPKSGKTKLVGGLAEKYNLLWFDLERGKDTLFQLPREYQERINVITLPDHRGMPIAVETMLKVVKGAPVEICAQHGKVACPLCKKDSLPTESVHLDALGDDWIVVVDSITQLKNSAIANIVKAQHEDYLMTIHDWAALGRIMDTFFSRVQASSYKVCCISHEDMVEMVDGKSKLVPVGGTTNFSRNTAKYFDDVVYCEVKNKQHVFASSSTYSNQIMTGSRSDVKIETKGANAKLLDLF